MKLQEAKELLKNKGFTLIECDSVQQQDKDIYDIQDYVLHHAKYKGLAGMQILMDWLSFDNPDASSFMGWIKTNYQPGCDILELQDKAVLVADEYISSCQNVPSQEVFYDSEDMFSEASEDYITKASQQAANGDMSTWDRDKINKGKKPSWVASIKDIGPRKKELKKSSSYSEIAMRKVTDDNDKKPYTSADWKEDKLQNIKSNEKILKALKVLIPVDLVSSSANENSITLNFGNYIFRIRSAGPRYNVTVINSESVMDRKSFVTKSLQELVDLIKQIV